MFMQVFTAIRVLHAEPRFIGEQTHHISGTEIVVLLAGNNGSIFQVMNIANSNSTIGSNFEPSGTGAAKYYLFTIDGGMQSAARAIQYFCL